VTVDDGDVTVDDGDVTVDDDDVTVDVGDVHVTHARAPGHHAHKLSPVRANFY